MSTSEVQEGGPEAQDRRRARRHGCRSGDITALIGHEYNPAAVRDLSRTGIGLIAFREFESGGVQAIGISASRRGAALQQLFRVVHSEQVGAGVYHIGGEFLSELSEEQVYEFC